MRSSRFSFAVTALLFLSTGCSGSSPSADQVPRPTSIDPKVGYATAAVPVLITGSGFLAKAQQPAGGGAPVRDTTHRAWLGNVELTGVTWLDTTTLKTTVPPGLPVGAQDLTVENALGERGALNGAYTVLSASGFSGTLAVE